MVPFKKSKKVKSFFDTKAGESSEEYDSDSEFLTKEEKQEKETEEIRLARELAEKRRENRRNVTEDLEKRYENEAYDEEEEEYEAEEETRREENILPHRHSSRFWATKCSIGKEKDIIESISALANQNEGVLSVFFRDRTKGTLYIEANNESIVKSFIRNIDGIFSKANPKLVALEDMEDLLEQDPNLGVPIGSWVRMKNGIYAGDLGKVVNLQPDTEKLIVNFIPRISTESKKGEFERPQQRFVDLNELSGDGKGSSVTYSAKRHRWMYKREVLTNEGYAEKILSEGSFLVEKTPLQKEIDKYNRIDVKPDTKNIRMFKEGETVSVTDGEFVGMVGKVVMAGTEGITIQPMRDDVFSRFTVDKSSVRREFSIGQAIRITSGPKTGDTGTVVSKKEGEYSILIDTNNESVIVGPDAIQAVKKVDSVSGSMNIQRKMKRNWGPRKDGRANIISKTVRILKGPYKGYIGIVTSASFDTVTVEMHANSKTEIVRKENIMEVEEKKEEEERLTGKTPSWGGGAQGKTPAWGGMDGKTPAWRRDER